MPRIDDTTELSTLAATDATASTIAGGQAYLADIARRLAPYFARSESRHRAQAYLQGLLSAAERKTAGRWRKSAASPPPMASSIC
jgi:hypothetical protein